MTSSRAYLPRKPGISIPASKPHVARPSLPRHPAFQPAADTRAHVTPSTRTRAQVSQRAPDAARDERAGAEARGRRRRRRAARQQAAARAAEGEQELEEGQGCRGRRRRRSVSLRAASRSGSSRAHRDASRRTRWARWAWRRAGRPACGSRSPRCARPWLAATAGGRADVCCRVASFLVRLVVLDSYCNIRFPSNFLCVDDGRGRSGSETLHAVSGRLRHS